MAAALVFDAAPHMEYRHENHTRLELAREMGQLAGLPNCPRKARSPCSTRGSAPPRPCTPTAARPRSGSRGWRRWPNSQPLTAAIEAAAKLLAKSELPQGNLRFHRSVAQARWPAEAATVLQAAVGRAARRAACTSSTWACPIRRTSPWARSVFPSDVLSAAARCRLETDLSCRGDAGGQDRRVGCFATPTADRRNATSEVASRPPGECPASRVPRRQAGARLRIRVSVRIVGEDGLAADDVALLHRRGEAGLAHADRRPPAGGNPRLVPRPGAGAGRLPQPRTRPVRLRRLRFPRSWPRQPLDDYAAVCLLDPTPLEPAVWQDLADYRRRRARRGACSWAAMPCRSNRSTRCSPAVARRQAAAPGAAAGRRRVARADDFQHPILADFRPGRPRIPWDAFPVLRYWELATPAGGATVVLPYSDGRPALLERPVGGGPGADHDHAGLRPAHPTPGTCCRWARPGRL